MRALPFSVALAVVLVASACNEVPVRNLTSSYEIQVQEMREKGKPAKLDIVWIVDDSPSMCQEQQSLASSFTRFLQIFQKYTAIDMRLAVTTTNVCPKEKAAAAIRGKFVYQPASDGSISPECVEKRVVPCLDDAQCTGNATLPDAKNWKCEAKPAAYQYSCDKPAGQGGDGADKHPGDILFVVNSMCRYTCDRETAPEACGQIFGSMVDGTKPFGQQACDSVCVGGQCSVDACTSNPLLVGPSGGNTTECGDVCASDWDCVKKCDTYLHDQGKCTTVCGATDCYNTCVFAGTDTKNYADKMFPHQDFLCSLACEKQYSCNDQCVAEFGKDTYRCLYPGGDKTRAGCLLPPATSFCPVNGPKWLDKGDYNCCADPQNAKCTDHKNDDSITCTYFKNWKSGDWAGNPDWKDFNIDPAQVYERIFETLFGCMATVGTGQAPCGNQEQGLLAAWMSLDPNGENAAQAKAFLRSDAYLLIVVISDEDDCSTTSTISAEKYGACACLRDTEGCTPYGNCDDKKPGPLYPTSTFINNLKTLKDDPAMVVFASIVGDVIPGSLTSPGTDEAAIRQRYYDCKCQDPATAYSPLTYACYSSQGKADLGMRYQTVAAAFGARYGQTANICDDTGEATALASIANLVNSLLTRVCLPRPIATDATIEVYKYKASDPTNRTLLTEDTEAQKNDFGLIYSRSGCARFQVTDQDCLDNCVSFRKDCLDVCAANLLSAAVCGSPNDLDSGICGDAYHDCGLVCGCSKNCATPECKAACNTRPENAIAFTKPLEADDRVEVRYQAKETYGQTSTK